MYMYIPCTYMFMSVCKCMNIYVHVCTMFRHVCTVLPILVQVVRIPDEYMKSYYAKKQNNLFLELKFKNQ
jgi:hypothetical protein